MKDAIVTIRFTPEQKDALKKAANESGMDVSNYVRIMVLRALKLIK